MESATTSVQVESAPVRADDARMALDEAGKADLAVAMAWDAVKVRAMVLAWIELHDSAPTTDACPEQLTFLDRDLDVVETELALEVPLVKPLTGRPSRTFLLAGRIDAVAPRAATEPTATTSSR